jgi:resuscitation-promoting factor RpfB
MNKFKKKATKHNQGPLKRRSFHNLKNHPFLIPVTTFLVLFFVSMVAFVSLGGQTIGANDTKVVRLSVDGKQQVVPTRAQTVRDLVTRLDIEINEKDIVEPSLDTPIEDDNFSVNIYKSRPITIIDGDRRITTVTAAPTAQAVATQAGLEVYPEDKLEKRTSSIEPEDIIREGLVAETVIINRATPTIINLYGTNIPVRTHAETVGEVLKEKKIQTLPDDVISPSLDTPLTPQTNVFIVRLGKQIDTKEEVIPAPVETVQDASVPAGTQVVKQQGSPGRKVVTYEIELQNGKEISRKVIQEVIAVEPVKQIIAKGNKVPTITVSGDRASLMLQAGIPSDQHGAADYIISRESGWRLNARNSGGCLGLGQACPGSKLTNVCPNYATDAICQLQFFNNYAVKRYGSWNAAYNFWVVNHWW